MQGTAEQGHHSDLAASNNNMHILTGDPDSTCRDPISHSWAGQRYYTPTWLSV